MLQSSLSISLHSLQVVGWCYGHVFCLSSCINICIFGGRARSGFLLLQKACTPIVFRQFCTCSQFLHFHFGACIRLGWLEGVWDWTRIGIWSSCRCRSQNQFQHHCTLLHSCFSLLTQKNGINEFVKLSFFVERR